MKTINKYIAEKLKISKNPVHTLFPETKYEFVEMIKNELNQNGNECSLNHINTSKITDMRKLFAYTETKDFNGDISQWDVSNVTDMYGMFANSKFTGENSDITDWDVSNVTNMGFMFYNTRFNGDLSGWDVSNVKDMDSMFLQSRFNNNSICRWNVLNVKNMISMFKETPFNQDLSTWTIYKDTSRVYCFNNCPIERKSVFHPLLINSNHPN